MNGFKKTYTLYQHTPIIHFQYDEAECGAALRASEVRPKLDQFLQSLPGMKIKSEWKLPETDSLRYKLRIEGSGRIVELSNQNGYGIYYGNTGRGRKIKGIIFNGRKLSLTIICHIPDLMELIDEHLSEFFICMNFGQMQSKGFGSFTVDQDYGRMDPEEISQILCTHYGADSCYYWDSHCLNWANGSDNRFDQIKKVYSIMKSGYNIGGQYCRSKLFRYMHTKSIANEKAFMKKSGLAGSPLCDKPSHAHSHENHITTACEEDKYVRALLGYGQNVRFIRKLLPTGKPDFTAGTNNIAIISKDVRLKEKFRFPSPVFFKVVSNVVFMIGTKIDDRIWNMEFSFRRGTIDKTLKTPSFASKDRATFLSDFMEYCYREWKVRSGSDTDTAKSITGVDLMKYERREHS